MKKLFFNTALGLIFLGLGSLQANPTGGIVTSGVANLSELGGALTVNQVDQRVIIQWDSFSIALGEVTNFNQPVGGTALNRVMLANPSEIFGQLQATGNVILINPNGILVGATGQIDVAGFMASTLDVPDAEFLAGGDLRFTGSSASVVTNLGSITAREGDIFLLGSSVTNAGILTAANGTVGLAAGNQVLVSATGDERIFVEISSGGKVEHNGEIRAAIAELKAKGTDPNVIAVSVQGLVEVTGVQRVGGKVYLSGDGGKVFINAPVEAKPAPEANPISGTLVKIGGGDLELRDTNVQAFGPGEAQVDVDATRDILLVNATLGTEAATSGSIDVTAGNDITLISENGGNAEIGARGVDDVVQLTVNAVGDLKVVRGAGNGGGGISGGGIGGGGIGGGGIGGGGIGGGGIGGGGIGGGAGIGIGGDIAIDLGLGSQPDGAGRPDDGIIIIDNGDAEPDPIVNIPKIVPSVARAALPTSGPTSITTVVSTSTAVRTTAANAVAADSNQRAPRLKVASQPQASMNQVVISATGASDSENGGVNIEAFKKMFSTSGVRSFVETRIGGQ